MQKVSAHLHSYDTDEYLFFFVLKIIRRCWLEHSALLTANYELMQYIDDYKRPSRITGC
jgi:hypothetical protein